MPPTPPIRVLEETIAVTLPSTSVRMLFAQPFLHFREPLQEPFRLSADCTQHLLSAIDRIFAISEPFNPQFVLFPEFSLPGIAAVEKLVAAIVARPNLRPLVVMGGVDGLSHAEYRRLCELTTIHVDAAHAADTIDPGLWINTSVTIIRDDAGQLSLWLQPKLSPSWTETGTAHQSMFQGSAVRLFRAKFDNDVPCRFFSVLCFDWIGRESGALVPDAVLDRFNTTCHTAGEPQAMHWAFVLQHNDGPNHPTFLSTTRDFLSIPTSFPFVRREHAAVVMVCTAASLTPIRKGTFGYSSIVFSPTAPFDTKPCMPTFCTRSSQIRGSNALQTCKDVVFREMGECAHGIEVRVPAFVVCDPTDRTPPVVRAEVFSLVPPIDDPRIPDAPVSPVVKWVNDELDDIPDHLGLQFSAASLVEPVRHSHGRIVNEYRRLESQRLAVRVHASAASKAVATTAPTDPARDADTWGQEERNAIRHIVQTLVLIGSVATIEATTAQLHGREPDLSVEIAAIRGPTHADCLRALAPFAQQTHSPILLITRDNENLTYLPRELEAFADPRSGAGVKAMDAQTLLARVTQGTDAEFTTFVTELLSVPDRRII